MSHLGISPYCQVVLLYHTPLPVPLLYKTAKNKRLIKRLYYITTILCFCQSFFLCFLYFLHGRKVLLFIERISARATLCYSLFQIAVFNKFHIGSGKKLKRELVRITVFINNLFYAGIYNHPCTDNAGLVRNVHNGTL